jgi:outer membrane protein assembly factor BamD (BamD/ComL family)
MISNLNFKRRLLKYFSVKQIRFSVFYIWIFLFYSAQTYAAVQQDNFQTKYLQGKEYYINGKYGPAMEVLLPITKEAPGNNFEEYAHYFYSLAALKSNKFNEAYQMLLQLINKYPQWHNIEDAYYLAANTAFELKKYRYGLNFLKDRSPKLKTDIDALKETYFLKLYPMDSLKAIQKSYPNDPVLAKVLLKRIFAGQVSERDKMLTDYLIQEFKIQPTDISSSRKTILKDSYNVAVLFPFMVRELGTEGSLRSNPFAAEMYAGIQLAIDSLRQKKIKINVYAYDTEKDNVKIQEMLKLPELKSMDLIIGPLIPAQNTYVNQFALANLIETVNPLSNNLKLTEGNEYVYLFQPSLERQAQQVADYALKNLPSEEKKNVFIFYSDNPRDSLLALNYRDSITARNFHVAMFEQVNKDRLSKITLTLSDSAKVVTANHIFVASADQNVATNVISALEISQLITPVFTVPVVKF